MDGSNDYEQFFRSVPDYRSLVSIRVHGFRTDYTPHPVTGEPREIHMVEYEVVGESPGRSINIQPVLRLRCTKPPIDADDKRGMEAWGRWQTIKPHYDAWRAGQELSVEGTPLGAWAGLTADQARYVRLAGIATVEQLAGATSAQLQAIQLPGVQRIQEQAKLFLQGRDKSMITTELAAKDEQIAGLMGQIEELRAMVLEQAADKPRRGRPPRAQEIDEDAA